MQLLLVGLDGTKVRAMFEKHFALSRRAPAAAHAIYHDDAVLEFPQSGERFPWNFGVSIHQFRG